MCGIVATVFFPAEEHQEERHKLAAYLFTMLMRDTESRGDDATGIALQQEDGKWYGLKGAVKAEKFIYNSIESELTTKYASRSCREGNTEEGTPVEHKTEYFKFIKHYWLSEPEKVKIILGHCRKATKGKPENLHNNHPLVVGDFVGVHNGGVKNSDYLFKHYKNRFSEQIAEVDSEVIFHLLNLFNDENNPFNEEILMNVATRIQHTYNAGNTYLAFTPKKPGVLYASRIGARPLVFCYTPVYRMLFIVSEEIFLNHWLDALHALKLFNYDVPYPVTQIYNVPEDSGFIIDGNKELDEDSDLETNILERIVLPKSDFKYHETYTAGTVGNRRFDEEDEDYLRANYGNFVGNQWDRLRNSTLHEVKKEESETADSFLLANQVPYDPEVDSGIEEIKGAVLIKQTPACNTYPPRVPLLAADPTKSTTIVKHEPGETGTITTEERLLFDLVDQAAWNTFIRKVKEKFRWSYNVEGQMIPVIKPLLQAVLEKNEGLVDEANLALLARYLLLYRVTNLKGLDKIVALIEQELSIKKDKLAKLLDFKNFGALKDTFTRINRNAASQN
jgi:hypothetical protein